ncbi:unnamed protein product [Urochloa humidicola]
MLKLQRGDDSCIIQYLGYVQRYPGKGTELLIYRFSPSRWTATVACKLSATIQDLPVFPQIWGTHRARQARRTTLCSRCTLGLPTSPPCPRRRQPSPPLHECHRVGGVVAAAATATAGRGLPPRLKEAALTRRTRAPRGLGSFGKIPQAPLVARRLLRTDPVPAPPPPPARALEKLRRRRHKISIRAAQAPTEACWGEAGRGEAKGGGQGRRRAGGGELDRGEAEKPGGGA